MLWRGQPAPTPSGELAAFIDRACNAMCTGTIGIEAFGDDGGLRLWIQDDDETVLEFSGCTFIQMETTMYDVARISAFAPDVFIETCPNVARQWPALSEGTVFRFEPQYFGKAAGYVVASTARLSRSRRADDPVDRHAIR